MVNFSALQSAPFSTRWRGLLNVLSSFDRATCAVPEASSVSDIVFAPVAATVSPFQWLDMNCFFIQIPSVQAGLSVVEIFRVSFLCYQHGFAGFKYISILRRCNLHHLKLPVEFLKFGPKYFLKILIPTPNLDPFIFLLICSTPTCAIPSHYTIYILFLIRLFSSLFYHISSFFYVQITSSFRAK